MIEVTRREFQLHPYKYLEEGQFVVTNRGVKEFVVTIQPYSKEFKLEKRKPQGSLEPDYKPEMPEAPKEAPKKIETAGTSDYTPRYGCGCKMGDTRLCPKHHRS